MPDAYRRSIAELATRYEFEPGLRDIYVEGDRDKALLKWFFERDRLSRVVVYPIELSVEIPTRLLIQYREYGNRGRIIVFCKELDRVMPPGARNFRGLIDKDYSELLMTVPTSPSLLCTDFSCIESYALSEPTLRKFCHLYLGLDISYVQFQEIFGVLVELFLLRAAKISLAPAAPWVSTFTRRCLIEAGHIIFDRDSFVDGLLNASAGLLTRQILDEKIAELRTRLSADFRQQINGHDLIQMLSWFAHHNGVDAAIYNSVPLQRALVTSVEFGELLETVLFQAIRDWSMN